MVIFLFFVQRPGAALHHAVVVGHSLDGAEEAFDVQPEAHMLHVPAVELRFLRDLQLVAALWNQYDLLAERDKYGANDVRPGLTGWAQIHGRDELEITEKAKLDGWYVEHMSFWLDVKCFFGTIRAVADHDGVVEGGTGTLHEEGK